MSIRRRTAAVSIVLALAGLLAACGKAATTESSSGVEITKAWARTTQPGAKNGAAYLTISSSQTDRLDSASVESSIAGMVQLHETVMADGTPIQGTSSGGSGASMPGMDMSGGSADHTGSTMDMSSGAMTMREVAGGFVIPSGKSFVLAPGGYHLMLMDLAKPLTAGQKFTLTLHFQRAGDQAVEVEVRDDAP